MGDKEFENFLQGNGGDDDDNNSEMHECQKRVMMETVGLRMEFVSNLYESTVQFLSSTNTQSEVKASPDTIQKAETFMLQLMKQSSTCLNQLDYLLSRLVDEIDPDTGELREDD